MIFNFTKMNGAGNDFIVFDNRNNEIQLSKEQREQLCHRQNGIGADGILIVEKPQDESSNFRMRYYNSDGGEAEMCGNGARCFAKYVRDKCKFVGEKVIFETLVGNIIASYPNDLEVRLLMSKPFDYRKNIQILTKSGNNIEVFHINTGVPHVICFVDDIKTIDVLTLGRELREHKEFSPNGANVNFIKKASSNSINIRTYERGVEDETLACGTGVTAVAIVFADLFNTNPPITVKVKNGDLLSVDFKKKAEEFEDVFLQGPAKIVFEGEIKF